MNALWILVFLIVLSGFFALAEMALASARRGRLMQMANEGNKGATAALALAIKEHPSRLLAATLTGITAAAFLMGIYGESALSASIQAMIPGGLPLLTEWRGTLSFAITIVIVTAVSIILGEIVPKRIAIAHPEQVAAMCAPFHDAFHPRVITRHSFTLMVGGPDSGYPADPVSARNHQCGGHHRLCG